MENPLLEPRPDGLIDQVRAYARDIAYLVVHGECDATRTDNRSWDGTVFPFWNESAPTDNIKNFEKKWKVDDVHKAPTLDLLSTFGYMNMFVETRDSLQSTPLVG